MYDEMPMSPAIDAFLCRAALVMPYGPVTGRDCHTPTLLDQRASAGVDAVIRLLGMTARYGMAGVWAATSPMHLTLRPLRQAREGCGRIRAQKSQRHLLLWCLQRNYQDKWHGARVSAGMRCYADQASSLYHVHTAGWTILLSLRAGMP
jgi:hypothetical protein